VGSYTDLFTASCKVGFIFGIIKNL